MKIVIGCLLIFAAVWGVLDVVGVVAPFDSIIGDITVFQIIVGVLVAAFIVKRLSKLKLPSTVFGLSLLFMVFERNVAFVCGLPSADIINNWLLLGLTMMLCAGLFLLLPKWRFGGGKMSHGLSGHRMGSNTVYIDCATFAERYIENNMSATVVRFENTELYGGNGELCIENNMGAVTVFVPQGWCVETIIENNMGHVNARGAAGGNGPLLRIKGENNMGAVDIVRI